MVLKICKWLCGQVGYCVLHNGRMCSALETRYLGIRERCLAMARTLSALSYEAQAPLKMRSRTLSSAHACESVNAYLQVQDHSCSDLICHMKSPTSVSSRPLTSNQDRIQIALYGACACPHACARLPH